MFSITEYKSIFRKRIAPTAYLPVGERENTQRLFHSDSCNDNCMGNLRPGDVENWTHSGFSYACEHSLLIN